MLSEIISYINAIKARKFLPVYFLYGSEGYFIERIIDCLKSTLFSNIETKDIVTFTSVDTSWQEIISYANQYSLFGETRLLIVNNAQSKNFVKLTKDLQILVNYLETPNSSTILTIIYNDQELPANKSILKLLKDYSYLFKIEKLSITELRKFIVKYLARRQISLEQDAMDFLIDSTSDNLSSVVNELDKIILNNKAGSCVSFDDVNKVIVNSRNFNVFDFCNAIIVKDPDKALLMLKEFAFGKDFNALYILATLYKEFTKLLAVKNYLGNTNAYSGYYKSNSEAYNHDKLRQIIHLLRVYDLKIKYGSDESTKLAYLYELITFIIADYDKTNRFLQNQIIL
ncbi:MAG: DNA polymerase III subunit delta [Solitalea-like symbiont of Acarus siro]